MSFDEFSSHSPSNLGGVERNGRIWYIQSPDRAHAGYVTIGGKRVWVPEKIIDMEEAVLKHYPVFASASALRRHFQVAGTIALLRLKEEDLTEDERHMLARHRINEKRVAAKVQSEALQQQIEQLRDDVDQAMLGLADKNKLIADLIEYRDNCSEYPALYEECSGLLNRLDRLR